MDFLHTYRAKFGIDQNPSTPYVLETFEEQVQVLLEEKAPGFSFTFGIPPIDVIQAMKQRGIFVIGTATTVEEAEHLDAAGVNAIVAQGYEAGGHRGTFINPASTSLIGTIALVPQVVDHVTIPVIAAGGITNRKFSHPMRTLLMSPTHIRVKRQEGYELNICVILSATLEPYLPIRFRTA